MTIKKLITDAMMMLGIDVGDKVNRKILLRCANLALWDVSSNFREFVDVQTFDVVNKRIEYSQFKRQIVRPIRVIDATASEVKFEVYVGCIGVPDGRMTVTYAYLPQFTNMSDKIALVDGAINAVALFYGMLSNYASISGLTNEAAEYNAKFEKQVAQGVRCGRMRVLPLVS